MNEQITSILKTMREDAEYRKLQADLLGKEIAARFPDFKNADILYRKSLLDDAKAKMKQTANYRSQTETLLKKRNAIALSHGIDVNKLEPSYTCPLCKDTGFQEGKLCSCVTKRYRALLTQQGTLYPFTFKNDQTKKMAVKQSESLGKLFTVMEKMCQRFPQTKYLNYVVIGGVGVGKSCLAYAVTNALLERGFDILFMTAHDFNAKILQWHLAPIENKHSFEKSFLTPDMLLIDDLGSEPLYNNVTIEYLYLVLDSRMRKNKHTFITSNLLPEIIKQRYGERISSRLFSDVSIANNIDGDDLRFAKKKK